MKTWLKEAFDEYQDNEKRQDRLYLRKEITIAEVLALHRRNQILFAERCLVHIND